MAVQHAWKNDKKVTATMVEDMMFDPILAAKILVDVKLPPHEELRLLLMWTTAFTSDDSGFSTGKSFTIALVAALRCILFHDRICGVLSKTFAQGKLVFDYFDRWYNANPRFRYCIKHHGKSPRLVHGNDAHVAYFRGASQIRVLPPDFMKDAERLKSERWNDGFFDEWTTYNKMMVFNKTVIGRVTRGNNYPDCPVRQNHIHLASTPGFMHHPSYGLIKTISRQINSGNTDYARFTCNYRHIPKKKWGNLVNRKFIFHMQTNLTKGMVKAEVDGLWQRDSGSFYNSAIIDTVRHSKPTLIEKRLRPEDIYVAAFDVARGGGSGAGRRGDDFAITVICIPSGNGKPHQCLTVRKNSVNEWQMAGIIHSIHRAFNLSLIGFDQGGGGLFVRDKLREKLQLINNVATDCQPILELLDNSGAMGDRILVPIKRSDVYISLMWGKMGSESVLVNRIHNEFQSRIDSERITFSGVWDGWTGNESQWDATNKRAWLNENTTLSPTERYKAEMDLAVSQLVLVDIKRDDNGIAVLDSHNMYQFGSKAKKDSAYSLVYCGLMLSVWEYLLEHGFTLASGNNRKGIAIASGNI